jgi:hypothetical protein
VSAYDAPQRLHTKLWRRSEARGYARGALYSDQQAIDSTTPSCRAMIQMASVFGEQERQIVRSRAMPG